jgi:hypothetical protein
MTPRVLAVLLGWLVAGYVAGCQLLEVPPAPPAPGARECIDVPEPTCMEILEGRINNRAPIVLAGYRVTCKAATCTADQGEAEASLLWADGMTETFAYTWFGPTQ